MKPSTLLCGQGLAAVAVSQNTTTTTTKTDYDSLYNGRCAESTSAVDTYISNGVMWAPYTDYTNYVSRTWTTIYPSPTPTSFPTKVLLTHISSATNDVWATLSFGSVVHSFVTMVVVSFEYEKEFRARPTGLAVCRGVGG
ncbi:hypothetical protein V8F06_011350 [Rhypophila decipiens]